MRFTRFRDLAAACLIAALLVHLIVQVGYDALPPLPVLAGAPLLLLAVLETVLGFNLRARIARRPGTRPVDALPAARAVALAKASSVVGAVTTGGWLGLLGYVLPRAGDVAAASDDTVPAGIGVGCAAALVAAALWLEHCCRTPDGRPDELDREAEAG